ncbi:MAG TPA: hypothetical protein VI028_01640 [Solirubrobacterales bacterium]
MAVPPAMPSASWVIEWKWWKEKIPSRHSVSQPFEARSFSQVSASWVASTPW